MKNPSKYSKGSTGILPVMSSVSLDIPHYLVTSYRSLVSKLTVHILSAAVLSVASLSAQEPLTKPQNYDEIRSLLSRYMSSHGLRKEALFSQGDAALPTLFFLFEEEKTNRYLHNWLVSAMIGCSHSKEAKKKVADFLVKRLESTNFENERSLGLVFPTMKFLVETDPEQARRTARKILNMSKKDTEVHSNYPVEMMILTLTEVGTMEDVECLEGWNFLKETGMGAFVRMQGDRAIEHIKLRTVKPQDYSDMRAMLKEWMEEHDFIWPSRFIDGKLLEARESFRAKGDDPFHVFTFLFNNNTDGRDRETLLSFTNYGGTQGRMAQVADFLAKTLEETDVEQWNAGRWISHALSNIERTDPGRAKRLAKKALNSPKQEIQERAIRTYRDVGTLEDVETVRNWYIQQAKSEGRSEDEQLEAGEKIAESMKESIKSREN